MPSVTALDAIADGTRRRLLTQLAAGPLAVRVISHRLGVTISAASQHLKTLRMAGLVTSHPEGRLRIYRLAPDALEAVRREAAQVLGSASSPAPGPAGDPLEGLAAQRAVTWPQLDPLALLISFRVERLVAAMHRDLQELAAEAGLSRGELLALGAIAASGRPYEASPTELKARLWISLPGIGKRLNLLESRGMIRRFPNPEDRRGQRIRLTAEGVAALEATRLGEHIPSHRALASMSRDDKIELERLLRRWQMAIPGRTVR